MPDPTPEELLRDATARDTPVVLIVPGSEGRRTRFLGDDPGGGVWIEVPARQFLALDDLRARGGTVAAAFRSGEFQVQFATTIVRCDPAYRVSGTLSVEAVLLARPRDARVVQRRAGYRVRLPIDAGIKARAWVVPNVAAEPGAPAASPPPVMSAEVRDLSATGLGLILRPRDEVPPAVKVGDTLRVEMTTDGKTLAVTGRARHDARKLQDGSLRTGLDFTGTDRTIEGRRTLAQVAQLVAELQRAEARRRKVG
ncbi:MAG TPA: PilZ domain-containing protein [Humisphaera sp.]